MPELPEAEVVRRGIDRVVRGRTLVEVVVGRDRAVRRDPDPAGFAAALTGRRVTGTRRLGKFLLLDLAPVTGDVPGSVPDRVADEVLVVHLGMSGRLLTARADDPADPRPPHTHVVGILDDGGELRFVDPRTFGHVFRGAGSPGVPGGRPAALAHLGPDALDDLTTEGLAAALAGRRVALKARLLDQTAVAGLGNIYTDEILHRAGLSPHRPSGAVEPDEVVRLVEITGAVLADAIAAGGSSLGDAQYVGADGRPGRYQEQHRVHARSGKPCPGCATTIVRTRVGGRTTSWCPRCQR